jgi:hypothetical protein
MRSLRLTLVAWLVVAAALLVPAAASAVTVDQIVELSRAGVTETVILALIDRDKTIFALEPEQLVTLKAQGVSEPVILAMLKSGREEGERAAQAAAELNAGFIMSSLAPAPDVVVVGHGPDVPNGGWSNGSIYGSPVAGVIPVPYAVGVGGGRRRQRVSPPVAASASTPQGFAFQSPFTAPFTSPFHEAPVARPIQNLQSPVLCVAQVRGANSPVPLSFVTQCPSVMQPRRGR